MLAEEGHASGPVPPPTLFTRIYNEHVVKPDGSLHFLDEFFGFSAADKAKHHLGQIQFESIVYSMIVAILLISIVLIASGGYQRIPRGMRNFLEICVEGLRGMIRMLMGPAGDRYLPYLGSLFIFIFCMNFIGLIPTFRSPTATLSITAGMGVATFFFVQGVALKVNGLGGYLKHLMGPVIFLAPLMIPLEILGELIKPASLSMRLYGNISGEDTLMEWFLHLTGVGTAAYMWMVYLLATFTSFLQAFIFTALTSIYLQLWTHHEEEHPEGAREEHAATAEMHSGAH